MQIVLTMQALAVVGFGLSRSFWVGAPLLAVVGAGSLCAIATLNTAVQTGAPDQLRGRVIALWVLSYTASYPLGSVVEGWSADRIGPGPTAVVAGSLMCAAAAVLLLRVDLARSLDGRDDVVVVDPMPASA
jgi:predicted MFS family arabinose efflux permease